MKTRQTTVTCERGLHLREATRVAHIACKAGVPVSILCKDCPKIDACSVFQMLAIDAAAGTSLKIEVEASDEVKAREVLQALTEVFEQGSGI